VNLTLPQPIKQKDKSNFERVVYDLIVARTLAGYDKDNAKFKKYTKGYADKKGVGVNEVDLVLDGEMLDSLKVKVNGDKLEIGYPRVSKELAGKVEGNILGTYGQDDPIPGKARDFLGLSDDDLEILMDSYENEIEDEDLTDKDIEQIARDAARELIDGIDFDGQG